VIHCSLASWDSEHYVDNFSIHQSWSIKCNICQWSALWHPSYSTFASSSFILAQLEANVSSICPRWMRANHSTVVWLPASKRHECCSNRVALSYQLECFSAPASSNKEWLGSVSSVSEESSIACPKTFCALVVCVSDGIQLSTSLCKICPDICSVRVHSSNIVDSIKPHNWTLLQDWISITAPEKLSTAFIHDTCS